MAMITRDDEVLGGEPRIRGTRIGVRYVLKLLRDGGLDIETVSDELDVDNASIQGCIEYYDARRDEMEELEADESDVVAAALSESRA